MNQVVQKKVQDFFSKYPARSWDPKQIIIHADERPSYVFYIESGDVRQYIVDKRGEEIVVNTLHHPAFFPMTQALTHAPNHFFFEAVTQCRLHAAPHDEVLRFLADNQDVTQDLLSRVLSGLDGVLMRMVYSMSESAYVRVLHELMLQSHRIGQGASEVTLPMKEYELGQLCGLSRETVSREFKKLKKQKLVALDHQTIHIYDIDALQREFEQNT